MENIDKIYELLDSIEVTKENSIEIANIRQLLAKKNFLEALTRRGRRWWNISTTIK